MSGIDAPGLPAYCRGSKAQLEAGHPIAPGHASNYGKRLLANFVCLSETLEAAATWGAELARGEGRGRIYIVEPTGAIEDDPHLTNKKFAGNPTKSCRSRARHPRELAPAPQRVLATRPKSAGRGVGASAFLKTAVDSSRSDGRCRCATRIHPGGADTGEWRFSSTSRYGHPLVLATSP